MDKFHENTTFRFKSNQDVTDFKSYLENDYENVTSQLSNSQYLSDFLDAIDTEKSKLDREYDNWLAGRGDVKEEVQEKAFELAERCRLLNKMAEENRDKIDQDNLIKIRGLCNSFMQYERVADALKNPKWIPFN